MSALTPLRVRLPFRSEDEFVAHYGAHVGRDGFFLATRAPKPAGTRLLFELVLESGQPLLRGEGVVVRAYSGDRPGMAVRFLRLDRAGQALVQRLVGGRGQAGAGERPHTGEAHPTAWAAPGGPSAKPTNGSTPRSTSVLPGEWMHPATSAPVPESPPSLEELAPPGPALTETPPVTPEEAAQPASGPEVPAEAQPSQGPQEAVDEARAAPAAEAGPVEASTSAAERGPEAEEAIPTPRPQLDEPEAPELVVTEFVGAGPRGPAGLQRAAGAADVHAAVTPHAGTPAVSDLDEPAAASRFRLSAPVSGDEPFENPETSFRDVTAALTREVHERPTQPIPLVPSMETGETAPPPLDEDPLLGAIPLRPEGAVPLSAPPSGNGAPALEARAAASPPGEEPRTPPSTEVPGRTRVLGIDIGAESVRMACIHDGHPEPVAFDSQGTRFELPIRLIREPGAAPRVLPLDAPEPSSWVGAPLPFLGLRADSPLFRTVARRWPAVIVADERGEVAFALEGGTVGAVELTATLLRWLRQRAEESTGGPVTQTVLAVPVSYTAVQRERLRQAASRAGLEGVRLVHAPTAAAMAFAHGRGLARRRILVWRMGASAFDVAVLAVSGNDLDMVACAGDASLGGMNFDEQIALAMDKTARADPALLRKRVAEADQLKRMLDDPAQAEASLEGGAHLARAELEARTSALVERGVLLTRELLRSASLAPDSLDELILVGGTTRLPHVRRMVEEAVGRSGRTDLDDRGAVALGAAMVGHLLAPAGPKSASRTAVHEVLGVPLEAIAPELGHVRVLERNTRLPAEKTLTVTLPHGIPLELQIFQGPGRAPDPRSFLGLLRASPERPGDWILQFSLDASGILHVSATSPSGKQQTLTLEMPHAPAEPEAAPRPPEPEAAPLPPPAPGLLGGLKRLFGRR